MRYFLYHLSTFVPIFAKIIVAHFGVKLAWLMYVFFTYILLEHKPFNGYPVHIFANLQRQAEVCMVISLFLARWVSPLLAPVPFAFITLLKGVKFDSLIMSFAYIFLVNYDLFQIICVIFSIITFLLDNEEVEESPEGWHRACQRRIMFRSVQVFTLMNAYESISARIILLCSFVLLKVVIYIYTDDENVESVRLNRDDPVAFFPKRISHRL